MTNSLLFALWAKNKGGGITPTGDIDIYANGYYNVAKYDHASVHVTSLKLIAASESGGASGFTDSDIDALCSDRIYPYVFVQCSGTLGGGQPLEIGCSGMASIDSGGGIRTANYYFASVSETSGYRVWLTFEKDTSGAEDVYSATLKSVESYDGNTWADVTQYVTLNKIALYDIKISR